MEVSEGNCRAPEPVAGPDREVHVRNQVMTAMRMALSLSKCRSVRADEDAFEGGLFGVAEGAATEILRILGFDVHNLINLSRGKRRATIAELEKILSTEETRAVKINPDGSISAS